MYESLDHLYERLKACFIGKIRKVSVSRLLDLPTEW